MGAARSEFVWPMYFAAAPLDAPRLKLKEGEPFPFQDKFYIRGLANAYGVQQADTVPFHELPYVIVLNVRSEDMARQIKEQGLGYKAARKLLETGATG